MKNEEVEKLNRIKQEKHNELKNITTKTQKLEKIFNISKTVAISIFGCASILVVIWAITRTPITSLLFKIFAGLEITSALAFITGVLTTEISDVKLKGLNNKKTLIKQEILSLQGKIEEKQKERLNSNVNKNLSNVNKILLNKDEDKENENSVKIDKDDLIF